MPKEAATNWNVFSAQQGADIGRFLGTVHGTREQVRIYALRTWPTFRNPWDPTVMGDILPQPDAADATRESPLATQLSQKGHDLLDAFDEAARSWGWSSDQGTGTQPEDDCRAYDTALTALTAYILDLEKRASK